MSLAATPFHRAPVICTRQFAAPRGSSLLGRCVAPSIGKLLASQIAVSDFVARSIERRPDVVVIKSGVRVSELRWRTQSRIVLVMQRLEEEKTPSRRYARGRVEPGLGGVVASGRR